MTIGSNDYWAKESPMVVVEGEKPSFTFTIPGVSLVTSDTTLDIKVYKNQSSTSDSNLVTGSMSVIDGDTVVTKTLQSLVGGNTYTVEVWGTADGIYRILIGLELTCRRPGATL